MRVKMRNIRSLSRILAAALLPVLLSTSAQAQTAQPGPDTGQSSAAQPADGQTPPAEGEKKPEEAEKPREPLPPFVAEGPLRIPNYWDPFSRPKKPDKRLPGIRFLTSDGFPPFNFVSADGRLSGFNVEVARAVCEVLETDCTIQMRPFNELVTALEENRGDAIVAGIAISAKNREKLNFSDIFLRLPARFAAKQDNTLEASPAGLSEKWVATVSGTAHEAYLHAFFPNARIITYPNPQIARNALKSGDVDAYFGSALSLSFWLAGESAEGCCQFLGGAFTDPRYFGSGLAIAVARDNTALKDALDYALHRVHDTGRYSELYLRYFPVSLY